MRLAGIAAVLAVLLASVATGAEAPTGWDGSSPFACELQQAGFGTEVPDPEADPYCVEFDKREQNVSELGVVDFLANEPARVAAAVDKCFYFQSDRWRGSIVQDDGTTKTYEWDGHYFFDKATGDGGAWVSNFNVNGRTEDPSRLPGIPPEYAAHMGPGTGGVITRNAVEADPACVARAAEGDVYARPASAAGPGGGPRGCVKAGGRARRGRLGPLRIGESDRAVRARLGDPGQLRRGGMRWCARGGGHLIALLAADRSGEHTPATDARVVAVAATVRGVALRGAGARELRPGASLAAVRRALPQRRRIGRSGRTRILAARRGSPRIVGVRSRVRFLAVAPSGSAADLRRTVARLRRAGL